MTTPHLDDEALSAAFDGGATAAQAAHLSSCESCPARLASLAQVARAVGTPVAPRPAPAIDRAIEQALAAWSPAAQGGFPAAHDPAVRRAPPQRRSRSGWLAAAAGIAAAAVVVGALAVARRTSHRGTETASLAGPSTTALVPGRSAAPYAGAAPGASPTDDLGNQSDPAAVARLVTAAISHADASAAMAPGSGSASTPAPPTASDQLATTTCGAQAQALLRELSGGGAVVRFVAPLRWRGQPAIVVVVSRPGGLTGVIMKTADCSVLVTLPL